jgi:diguanylate cyclase (GGDEF)-like protein
VTSTGEGREHLVILPGSDLSGPAERLLDAEAGVLEMIAAGSPAQDCLAALAALLEGLVPDVRCAFFEIDGGRALRVASAPSLSIHFLAAVEGMALPGADGVDTALLARALGDAAVQDGMRGCTALPLGATGDRPVGVCAVFSDAPRAPSGDDWDLYHRCATLATIVLGRARSEQRLTRQALHDPLTGLPNRTLFLDRLEQALSRLERSETLVAVLFLDLDRFKLVNDSLGHEAGDRLLRAIAERLTSVLRPGDTAARFGGDEFTLLCENLTSPDAALAIAERVADAVRRPVQLGDTEVMPSTSVGIALSGDPTDAPDDLIRNADAAMYTAKERGRARFELFDDAMRARAMERLRTESDLGRAVAAGELALVYQPEIDLNSGRISGAEALLRWDHPERGRLVPADFLELAEDTGLIVPVGNWVLEEACRQLAAWWSEFGFGDSGRDDGWTTPFTMRVNVSRRQLVQPDLVAEVEGALRRSGAPAHALCLEMTERALMADERVSTSLEQLRELGVRLAVDDFGTGYSSLGSLKDYPVDSLKVDRSFVGGLGIDPDDTAIVTAVVNLAHTLGLDAVAEGVETTGQLEALRELGCDTAQGVLLAAPAAAAEIGALLAADPAW